MDSACLVSTVQAAAGSVMVWGIFSWHTLGLLVPTEHRLNATAYLSIFSDHVHPFMTTVYLSSDGYFQQDNAQCHKAQIISDWFLEHDNEFTLLKWPPQSPDLNPIEQLWDVVEREIHIMDVQPTNLQQLQWCYHVNMDQNLWGMFPTPCWIYATEELRQLWSQKRVQPCTSMGYLIKWPVSVCIHIYIIRKITPPSGHFSNLYFELWITLHYAFGETLLSKAT